MRDGVRVRRFRDDGMRSDCVFEFGSCKLRRCYSICMNGEIVIIRMLSIVLSTNKRIR